MTETTEVVAIGKYDENNKTRVITTDGRLILATKWAYGQETLFAGEDGKQYLQNAATLEVEEADNIDDELILEPHVAQVADVIMTSEPEANRKAKVPDKTKNRQVDAATARESKEREEREAKETAKK